MFGGGKKVPSRVGAREKREMAKMLKGGQNMQIQSQKEGGKGKGGPVVAVVAIFITAVALAAVLTLGEWKSGVSFHTGLNIDKVLFGPSSQVLTGMQEVDLLILSFVRGIMFFLAGGILPFFALVWIRLRDDPAINPLIAVWGTGISLCLAYYGGRDFLVPLLQDLFAMMN